MEATTTTSVAAFGALRAVPDSLDGCDAEAVSEAARAATLAQNLAGATRLAAAHALVDCLARVAEHTEAKEEAEAGGASRRPAFARLDPCDQARDHLSAAMSLTSWHARHLVTAGVQIHTRLPRLRKAVERGLVPEQLAVDTACRLAGVPDRILPAVESDVVGRMCRDLNDGHRPSREAMDSAIEAAVERHDPAAAQDAVDAAAATRSVRFRPERNGMASMWARLPVADAEKLRRRIDAVARAARDTGHPRSLDQLRADALSSLGDVTTDGVGDRLRDTFGDPDSRDQARSSGATADPAAGSSWPVGTPIHVSVIAAIADGLPNRVEFVRGAYSSFDWLCQELLESGDSRVRFEKIDPAPGAQDDPDAALRYRISPALAQRIRLRDGTCRHPGCTVDATFCDVDHIVPFDRHRPELGGPTLEWNLVCLCRRHHREKTFGRSAHRPGPLGELIIITETGHEHRTRPGGPLAQARDQILEHRWRQHIDRLIAEDGLITNPPGSDRSPA